jgi:hypothetical protein
MAAHADVYGQRLWYEAALLAGRIDEAGFLRQPTQYHVKGRFALLGAILADMRGDTTAALEGYRRCCDAPTCRDADMYDPPDWAHRVSSVFESPSLWEFLRMRLEVLRGNKS